MTKQLLEDISESVDEFQLRRCKQLIDAMKLRNEAVVPWKIQRIGGIKSHHFYKLRPLLEEYIETR